MTMAIPSGSGSDAKVIKYRAYDTEGSERLYVLTTRMTGLLLSMTEYLRWRNRWVNIPEELSTNDALDAYVSDLELRLMMELEFCNEMIKCINTDSDVQKAIRKLINSSAYAGSNPGTEMNSEELNTDIGNAEVNNPTCDLDILWAQCLAVVQTTNRFIVDVLEKIETATNAVELADVASDIPVAGETKNLVGINFVLEMVQYWQNTIAEGYNAGYTLEYEQNLACELFCSCKGDCLITVQRIFDIMLGRVIEHLNFDDIHDFVSLLETIFGVTLDGTIVTDMAFFAAWGSVVFAQYLFGDVFDGISMNLVLALAVNDASDDWMILCDNCPQTYCDSFEEELDIKSFLPSVDKPFGVWNNAGEVTNTEQSGGVWESSGGYDTNLGCIKSTEASGITNGQRINIIIDLGSTRLVNNCSWRGQRTANVAPAFATEYFTLLDNTGNLILNHDMGTTGADYELRNYNPATNARYVVISAIASGFFYRFDDVCIDYE